MRRSLPALPLLALALTACHRPTLGELHPTGDARVRLCQEACGDSVELTYLGVGGFVVRHGGHALLTAPSFTHPSLGDVLARRALRPDTALVDSMLKLAEWRHERVFDGARDILVGHSHYDHLLDVPYLMRRRLPDVRVYGSRTMKNLLAGAPWAHPTDTARAIAVDDSAATSTTPGRWIAARGGGFRFMPIRTSHAPNFAGQTIAPGDADTASRRLPANAWEWLMGQPYAYLIDALDADGRTVFRIYYEDAAARAPDDGLPPPLPAADQHPIDVAIICVGNHEEARDYPSALLAALRPRHVVLAHWEDFFRSPLAPPKLVPGADPRELAEQLRRKVGEAWTTPGVLGSVTILF